MNPLIKLKTTPPLLITLTLLCFGLLPRAQAVVPLPDGGYANFTTAEGTFALLYLTTGAANTGVGWRALFSAGGANANTGVGAGTLLANTADRNTATGALALLSNSSGFDNTANGAFALFGNTEAFSTLRLARALSLAMPPAMRTRPTVLTRSIATLGGSRTPQMERSHSETTPTALLTRPLVTMR
jgi:hypothetical protein